MMNVVLLIVIGGYLLSATEVSSIVARWMITGAGQRLAGLRGIDNIAVVSEVGMFLLLGMGAALSRERRASTTACFADERFLDD